MNLRRKASLKSWSRSIREDKDWVFSKSVGAVRLYLRLKRRSSDAS
jgi:hypothetical protein